MLDSHAHLDHSDFDADRDAVIMRARAAGLQYLLSIGGGDGPDHMDEALSIAKRYEWIYATVGVHPHEARQAEDRHFDMLRSAVGDPKVVAIGEIGLDYHYDHSPRDVQKRVLIRQLELAREVKLPIVIHCREAWSDLRQIIGEHWARAGFGGFLHCFSGSREDAVAFLDWGFLLSFAGNLTFKKAEPLRAVAREVPVDRLLSETDSPYLAPAPYRGKRNEPAYVLEVTRELASLHNLSEEDMGRQAVANFARLFRLE
ncbi:MAG: TatD family deoxyribonuclease [Acidobacteria bacterium]|nr:MAG: TatD family deoxyribonuclease [Acidobacteriota bacterium]